MNKKNIFYIVIIALIVFAINGCNNENGIIKETTVNLNNESKSNSYKDVTLREIQQELMEYLGTAYPDMELGSEEFFEFANKQIAEETDEEFTQLKNYAMIHSYLTEYVLEYSDYIFCKQLLEHNDLNEISNLCEESKCVKYNSQSNAVEFVITDEFLDQTIADIIKGE